MWLTSKSTWSTSLFQEVASSIKYSLTNTHAWFTYTIRSRVRMFKVLSLHSPSCCDFQSLNILYRISVLLRCFKQRNILFARALLANVRLARNFLYEIRLPLANNISSGANNESAVFFFFATLPRSRNIPYREGCQQSGPGSAEPHAGAIFETLLPRSESLTERP